MARQLLKDPGSVDRYFDALALLQDVVLNLPNEDSRPRFTTAYAFAGLDEIEAEFRSSGSDSDVATNIKLNTQRALAFSNQEYTASDVESWLRGCAAAQRLVRYTDQAVSFARMGGDLAESEVDVLFWLGRGTYSRTDVAQLLGLELPAVDAIIESLLRKTSARTVDQLRRVYDDFIFVEDVVASQHRQATDSVGYSHTNSKGVTYYLNSKRVTLRGGKGQSIYYFSKDVRPENVSLPADMTVHENPRNGFLAVARG